MEAYKIIRTKVAPDRIVVFISIRENAEGVGIECGTSCYGKTQAEIDSEIQTFANQTGARLDAEKAKQEVANSLID